MNYRSQKPRICLLTETYYPVVGGGETQTRVLATDLFAASFDVIVITRRSTRILSKVENVEGVMIYRTAPVGNGRLTRWIMVIAVIPMLLRQAPKYDVIFVSGFKALGIPAVLVSKIMRKRCILKADSNGEMSGAFFTGRLKKVGLSPSSLPIKVLLSLRNYVLRQANCFVAISMDIAGELAQHGVRKDKISVIANSVDTRKFCPVTPSEKRVLRQRLGIPQECTVVTFTGRLVSYKGLPLLLKVWLETQRKHKYVQLLLVGSGGLDMHNCEDQLKQYVRANNLAHNVQFTGDVHNVHEYLQASDIFVFPTEKEAFGISLIEAMACALPVITTTTGGIKDFVSHNQNGFVVQANDFEQLSVALDTMLSDKALASALGASALRTVQQRFARDHVAHQYTALFKQQHHCVQSEGS